MNAITFILRDWSAKFRITAFGLLSCAIAAFLLFNVMTDAQFVGILSAKWTYFIAFGLFGLGGMRWRDWILVVTTLPAKSEDVYLSEWIRGVFVPIASVALVIGMTSVIGIQLPGGVSPEIPFVFVLSIFPAVWVLFRSSHSAIRATSAAAQRVSLILMLVGFFAPVYIAFQAPTEWESVSPVISAVLVAGFGLGIWGFWKHRQIVEGQFLFWATRQPGSALAKSVKAAEWREAAEHQPLRDLPDAHPEFRPEWLHIVISAARGLTMGIPALAMVALFIATFDVFDGSSISHFFADGENAPFMFITIGLMWTSFAREFKPRMYLVY